MNNHVFQVGEYYSYVGAKDNPDYYVSDNYNVYMLDGVNYRKGVRGNLLVLDKELYEGGFMGNEGAGWECIFSITS